MTQQPQEAFDRSMEDALAWMKAVQQRLQINDNTQGPRAALEARLRETEVCRDHGLDSPVAFAVPLSQASGFPTVKWPISQALMCSNLLGILVEVQILIQEVELVPRYGISDTLQVTPSLLALGPPFHSKVLEPALWPFCSGRGTV